MAIQNGYIFNFNPDGSSVGGNITLGASASTTLPANIENLLLVCTGNCHFRLSVGASTAVVTDPLLSPQQGPTVVKLSPSLIYTLSVVQDAAATGILSWIKVAES